MLDLAARIVIGPVLYAQARRLRATALELPEPAGERAGVVAAPPHGHEAAVASAGSTQTLGLLVTGDSCAAGVGARTQREALAWPLAQGLAQRLRRPVRWQLVAESGLTSPGLLHRLMRGHLAPAELAVVLVGVNDITKNVRFDHALRKRAEIAEFLHRQAGAGRILFVALPEMERFPALSHPLAWYAGQAARRNNRLQARWARALAATHPYVEHVPMDGVLDPTLMSVDGFHPAPPLYARIAQRLAEVLSTARASTQP